jgi:translation initiation factor IF-1
MKDNDRDDKLTFEGIVIESNKGVFKVQVSDNHFVNCKLSGKMKVFEIKVIPNDTVIIEVSPYNIYLGRITRRNRQ